MNICLFADAQSVHIRQLTTHLAKDGHRVHVITHKQATLPSATVERFAVPPAGLLNPFGWDGRRRRYFREIFRKFDIINVHFLADWGLAEFLENREIDRAGLVASAWGSDIVDPPGETPASPDLSLARRQLIQSADAVTTCGPAFAATVAAFAEIAEESIQVVPFGVDLALFNSSGHSHSNGRPCIGFFKGFRAVYGPRILLRAIPKVLAHCPHVRFELIGSGAELEPCQALAKRLDVEHALDWSGPLDHSALAKRLHRWQLSVIPSVHEAFGVAALESQAMGVPVVASSVGGLADTVRDGETGLLFPLGNSAALAERVVRLLQDTNLREKMAAAGRDMVSRKYDWKAVARQWTDLYARVREKSCIMV